MRSRHTFYFHLRKVESGRQSCRVETPNIQPADGETFAQVLAELKQHYDVREPAIAERINVHVSTVNNWANGKSLPRPKYIHALSQAYPAFAKDRLEKAAGKSAPAPQSAEDREEVLRVWDRLYEDQRKMMLLQAKAVADANDQQG